MFLPPKRGATYSAQPKTQAMKTAIRNYDTASTSFSLPVNAHVLDGFIDPENAVQMRQLYRDLYYHDPICGTCVDVYSTLPFSNFSLTSLPDREMLTKFTQTCEALRVKSLFQALTIDQLVEGAPCGALSFDESSKIFDGYLPLNPDYVEFKWHPMFGRKPLMDVSIPTEAKKIFSDLSDPRVKRLFDDMPKTLQALFTQSEKLKLDPLTSVYIPRPSRVSYRQEGVSLFRRIVPIWLIEKTLLRGTIEQAHRRQRGITVVTAGDIDWIASQEELNKIGYDIIMADRDPLGAVMVTRPGLNFQEIKSPNDAWRHTDVVDVYTTLKLRGLGFSESMLSSEVNVNSLDSSMTAMISGMRTHRDNLVRAFLYEQVFPAVAMANNYRKEDKYMEMSSIFDNPSLSLEDRAAEYYRYKSAEEAHFNGERVFSFGGKHMSIADGQLQKFEGEDPTKFYCPTLNWHEPLRSEQSADYLDMLDRMIQKDIPVPIRTIMAAGGLSTGDIMASMDEDLELRKIISAHMKKLKKYMPQPPDDGGGGFDRSGLESMVDVVSSASSDRRALEDRSDKLAEINDAHLFRLNSNRLPTPRGRKLIEEKANKAIAQASVLQAERLNSEVRKLGAKGRPLARK